MPSPSSRSRTVPTKAATAPTLASPARSAATSRLRSKSPVWMLTRVTAISTPCDGREERDLGALAHRGRFVAQRLVQRTAQRLAACQRGGVRRTAIDQQAAQVADRGTG